MTDVRVSQQDRVGKAAQPVDLLGEVGRRIHDEPASGGAIDQTERRDELPLRRIAARGCAKGLAAAEVRHASVLRDPEDDRLDVSSTVIPSEARALRGSG
jgi:hypothetical protein